MLPLHQSWRAAPRPRACRRERGCGTGPAAHEHGGGGREESTTAPDRSETPAPASRSAPDILTEPPSRSHPFRPPFIASSIAAIALAVLHLQALRLAGQIFEADVVAIGPIEGEGLAAALELDAVLAVMAFIGALGVEVRLHVQLVMPGLGRGDGDVHALRSEEHTSELQSLMRISY